jgi:hypothetical protein
MFAALLSIVPNIVGGISDHFADKRKLKQTKVDGTIALDKAVTAANIDRISKGQDADIQWATTMAAASASSWKDEFWTIVLGIPAIMSFIPGLDVYVTHGFAALSSTPEWYQGLLLVAVGAAFGVQLWKKGKGMKSVTGN